MTELEDQMRRVLHRCAALQLAAKEGMPSSVVLVQVEHLRKLLDEVVPLLKQSNEFIRMNSLGVVHEEAFANLVLDLDRLRREKNDNTD